MHSKHRVDGNELTLLKNGAAYFPQLCADIDAAQHSIYLETYIFAADETGYRVAAALQRAALNGVTVRVLLDGFGSAELPQHWVDEMRTAGVEVQWFRREISPFTLQRSRMRRLRRLHRKMVVVDGAVAFVGGINIIDDEPGHGEIGSPRLDYAVRVEGAVAGMIHAAMRRLWGVVSWANFRKRPKKLVRLVLEPVRPVALSSITLLLRDNLRHRRDIERAYLTAIAGAQREVVIANAYFLPGRLFRRTLIHAARRGVRVVLLLQGKVEYRLQHYATHALYAQLLSAGVEIHEYQASYMHAKVAVVDGQWATVGSSNIDPFSLLLAREANLIVRDAGFAAVLRDDLMDSIARDSRRIIAQKEHRSLFYRLLGWVSYGIVRMLTSFIQGKAR
jgi:cardiolipin synthase